MGQCGRGRIQKDEGGPDRHVPWNKGKDSGTNGKSEELEPTTQLGEINDMGQCGYGIIPFHT